MAVAKSNPPTSTKQVERDPFYPAIPTDSFALIHAALPLPWDQLFTPTSGAGAAGAGVGMSAAGKGGGNQWPAIPDVVPMYSPKTVACMASWLSANMPLKAPLKGSNSRVLRLLTGN